MFNLSWHALILFRIYVIENKPDFVSFDDKNRQRDVKFLANVTFPCKTLIGISNGRVPKFVTSFIHEM